MIHWNNIHEREPKEEIDLLLAYRPTENSDIEYRVGYRNGDFYYSTETDNLIEGEMLWWFNTMLL